MDISRHFIACSVLFVILFPVYKLWAVLVFVSGYFIDVDHYFWCILRFGNLSLPRCYRFCQRKRYRVGNMLHIFHTVEFWVVAGVVSVVFYKGNEVVVFLLLMGFIVHLLLDFIDGLTKTSVHERAFSFLEWRHKMILQRRNRRKKVGEMDYLKSVF